MKIKFIILIMIIATGLSNGYAQQFRKPLKASSEVGSMKGQYHIGIKLGGLCAFLSKNDLNNATYLGHWGGLAGIHAERYFRRTSWGLEVGWAQRGTRLHRQSTYQLSVHEEGTITKEVTAAYDVVSARIPWTYLFSAGRSKKVIPYLFVSPAVEIPLSVSLQCQEGHWAPSFTEASMTTTTTINTSQSSTSQPLRPGLNLCAVAGAGLLVNVSTSGATMLLKFDIGMNQGLLNLATVPLKAQGIVIRSQCIEASLSLSFQLKKPLHDACHTFQ